MWGNLQNHKLYCFKSWHNLDAENDQVSYEQIFIAFSKAQSGRYIQHRDLSWAPAPWLVIYSIIILETTHLCRSKWQSVCLELTSVAPQALSGRTSDFFSLSDPEFRRASSWGPSVIQFPLPAASLGNVFIVQMLLLLSLLHFLTVHCAQSRSVDDSLRECMKFIDKVLESTLYLIFKKLLVEPLCK